MAIEDFIGVKATYDTFGQKIWGVSKDGGNQMIADLRGWGAIQNIFKNRDGSVRIDEAEAFQDELGEWIVDAINEKLKHNKNGK